MSDLINFVSFGHLFSPDLDQAISELRYTFLEPCQPGGLRASSGQAHAAKPSLYAASFISPHLSTECLRCFYINPIGVVAPVCMVFKRVFVFGFHRASTGQALSHCLPHFKSWQMVVYVYISVISCRVLPALVSSQTRQIQYFQRS